MAYGDDAFFVGRRSAPLAPRDPKTPPCVAVPELVGRNFFAATAPDRLWVADITYVNTDEGFLYLSFILDACSRRVVGWSMASHLRSELVLDALRMALWRRKSPKWGADPSLGPWRAVHGAVFR